MTTTIELSGAHQLINTSDYVTVIGTDGADSITLGPDVYGATLYSVESVEGSGWSRITLGTSSDFLTVSGVESILGSGGHDTVALTGSQSFLTVSGIESLIDLGSTAQWVNLTDSGSVLTIDGIETIRGSYGHDDVTLGDGQSDLTFVGYHSTDVVDTVTGNAGFNTLKILLSEQVTVSSIESIVGDHNDQKVNLAGSYNAVTISGIDTIQGGAGYDAVNITGSSNFLTVIGIDSLTNLSGQAQTAFLSGSSNFLTVHGIETVVGGAGHDVVMLGDDQGNLTISSNSFHGYYGPAYGDRRIEAVHGNASFNILTIQGENQVAVSSIESIVGDHDYQHVILADSTSVVTVNGIEAVQGGAGYQSVNLTGSQSFMTVSGIESLTDLSGNAQSVTLSGSSNFLTVEGIETIQGSYGYDSVALGSGQSDLTITGDAYGRHVEAVHGNATSNTLTIQGYGDVIVSSIESVVGDGNYQAVALNGDGSPVTVSGIEAIWGGGHDAVNLTGSQSYLTIAGIASLTDLGSAGQWVTLSGGSNSLTVQGIETVQGGYSYDDAVILGSGQSDLTIVGGSSYYSYGVESVTGNAAFNTLTIQGYGNVTLSSIESVVGTDGSQAIRLADIGNTLSVANIETIIGGAGYDAVIETGTDTASQISGVESLTVTGEGYHSVSVSGSAANLTLQGVDDLWGDYSYQAVHLTGSSAVITVNGIDVLYGTGQSDIITTTYGSSTSTMVGGGGGDTINLSSWGSASQTIAFASADDGSAAGVNSGYDTISNFSTGRDMIAIQSGPLLSDIDKGGSGVAVTSRASGAVDASSDEIAILTTTVSGSLTDSGYGNFRTALGSLVNDGVTSLIVAADNGTDTGIYLVKSDGTGGVGAGEVSLLGLISGTTGLTSGNFGVYAP